MKVSLKKAFKNDSVLFSTTISMILFVAILAYLYFSNQDFNNVGIYAVLGLFGIGILMILYRVIRLLTFVPAKKAIIAKVKKTYIYRSTVYVYLDYSVNGQFYSKKNLLVSSKYSRALNQDDEIEIFVAENNPKRALIVEAYFADENL